MQDRLECAAPIETGVHSVPSRTKGVTLNDFRAYMPAHKYIFAPTGELWPSSSVNSRIMPVAEYGPDGKQVTDKDGKPKFLAASAWLDAFHPVEQMTWAPGHPQVVEGQIIADGGWIERPGCACFNLYRPPVVLPGDKLEAGPWITHIKKIYPNDAEHIIRWLAHRVQRPEEKINHALVLGGNQGIGKDSLLEPVKYAVGPWNCAEVSPQHLLGRFNGFVKSIILRVSEARDLGEVDRFAFYDHMKTFTAAPPDVLRVDEKHLREYAVFNVCGVIITTNHKSDGIYLPADDRRHYVAWSDAQREDFSPKYWTDLYSWYELAGNRHVSAYLSTLDLSTFNPKAPPPKTEAFWSIVDCNRAPEDAELADALERLGSPDAVTIAGIAKVADLAFADWLRERRNSRKFPHRMEECGYQSIRNPSAQDGLWKVGDKRMVIYAKRHLPERDRLAAADKITARNDR